jgi:hypothetical protein
MLFAIAIIILGTACITGDMVYSYQVAHPDTKVEEPVTVQEVYQQKKDKVLDSHDVMNVNAEQWLCKYADNLYNDDVQVKMKYNWKDKYIKLTGEISKVHNNYDGCYISIRQKRSKGITDGWCSIVCYFYDDAEKQQILNMHPGDKVTITGYSRWDVGPILINSYVR